MLEFHDLADQLPMMSNLEFDSLKEDIKENGLEEPIMLFEGKILDGRNRYRACLEVAVEPVFKEFEGDREEAEKFSASSNLMRRHLTKSQKAMVLVKTGLVPPPSTTGRRRYGDGGIRTVADRYGVNHMTVYKAAYVFQHDNGRELVQQVLEGKTSVGRAEAVIRERLEGKKMSNEKELDRIQNQIARTREAFLKLVPKRRNKEYELALSQLDSFSSFVDQLQER